MSKNEVYKVVQTRKKGFGCIATQDIKRKTLILKEEAQIPTPNKNPRNKEHAKGNFFSERADAFVISPKQTNVITYFPKLLIFFHFK